MLDKLLQQLELRARGVMKLVGDERVTEVRSVARRLNLSRRSAAVDARQVVSGRFPANSDLTFPTPGGGLFPSEGIEDVNEKVGFQRRRRLGREPAPELACLDQRDHKPGQA